MINEQVFLFWVLIGVIPKITIRAIVSNWQTEQLAESKSLLANKQTNKQITLLHTMYVSYSGNPLAKLAHGCYRSP